MASAQAAVAAAYRTVNAAYKPFYDAPDGDLGAWDALDVPTVLRLVESATVARAAQASWHRAGGRGCPFGQKGCPPWGFVNCLACEVPHGG